jgi:menaquinone-9 beta-reductase
VTNVLIVGARCAGATLAIHLARKGVDVTIVDSADLPSDQPLSTHHIGRYGMRLLNELGVGDKVRAVASGAPTVVDMGDVRVIVDHPPEVSVRCPRRLELDAILLDEARAAGARIRTRTRLTELVRDGERVVGAVVRSGRQSELITADVVVGADGRSSTVARLVGAQEYHGYDGPRSAYWAYWPKPSWYEDDPRYRGAAILSNQDDHYLVAFPTNKDLLLLAITFPNEQLPQWQGRRRERLLERLRGNELTAPLAQSDPVTDVRGYVKPRFFFREAAGPGWALVGDAGLHCDPAPGLGISDALRDAHALADAIVAGGDAALTRYWRERDARSIEWFEQARNLGEPNANNPLSRLIYRKLAADPALVSRVAAMLDRELSPFALITPGELVRWVAGAVLRGDFGVVRPFLATIRRHTAVMAEVELRARLAAEAAATADRQSVVT